MKPATGNNLPESAAHVSIQLKLGGHSFSADTLPAQALSGDTRVLCSLVTPRTLLVPREAFRPDRAERYLRIAGLAPLADETTVHSDPAAPEVVVMAVARACSAALRDRLGNRLAFTSPLLHLPAYEGSYTVLRHTGDTLYVRSYGPELRYAAALAAPTEADVLVHMTDLDAALGLRNQTLHITGNGARETARLLRRYFRRVVCVS